MQTTLLLALALSLPQQTLQSDSTFFLKAVDAQLTFRPDALVLHQNGQHTPARKIR